MQYPALLVADTHFTASPRDEYRWGLWPWLREQCRLEKVKSLLFLGDLTDAKDNHSSALTNRLADEVRSTAACVRNLTVLPGNHDWLLDGQEFFRFLGIIPNVQYITHPTEDSDLDGQPTYYLPFTKNPGRDWKDLDLSHYRYVFMHQTLRGAVSSNGERMEGEELPDMRGWGKIYSGDIHVPQVVGEVEYVGSPYHVHFGDSFEPRCVLLERGGNAVDLRFATLRRVTVKVSGQRELERMDFRPGDQVKLRVELAESEKHEWSRIRREASAWLREGGVDVCGVELVMKKSTRRVLNDAEARRGRETPAEAVLRYVQADELGGDAYDTAMEILGK